MCWLSETLGGPASGPYRVFASLISRRANGQTDVCLFYFFCSWCNLRPGTQNASPSQKHATSGILNSDVGICLNRNVCPSLDVQLASRSCMWVPRRSADLLLFIFSLHFPRHFPWYSSVSFSLTWSRRWRGFFSTSLKRFLNDQILVSLYPCILSRTIFRFFQKIAK